ncbi:MAG: phosphoribosylanthranilate isomerase [Xanthomonadales bacterium]|nr:phosphoribosylanthranilate isomerase [Xanthomonadales bacterium]
MKTRIKFCGITHVEDVRLAVDVGADALGFIFASGSPRRLDPAQLDVLLDAVPASVVPVALFRNAAADQVAAILARSPRLLAQFHGDEPPEFCAAFGRPWWKAVPMGALPDAGLMAYLESHARAGCHGLVFDSHGGAQSGGSGRGFEWSRIPAALPAPLILAGGLTPETVADAVRRVRPHTVDVSSGIESAPGIKDHAKMRRFADEVFRARTD